MTMTWQHHYNYQYHRLIAVYREHKGLKELLAIHTHHLLYPANTSDYFIWSNLDHMQFLPFIVGAFVALGMITRFTFAFFVAPLGLCMVHTLIQHTPTKRAMSVVLTCGVGFLVVFGCCVLIDSVYFGYLRKVIHWSISISNQTNTFVSRGNWCSQHSIVWFTTPTQTTLLCMAHTLVTYTQ